MSLYCMARIRRLDQSQLQLAEVHARRGDVKSQKRVVRDAAPVTWLPGKVSGDPLSYEARYIAHIEGAFVPKGDAKAIHMLVKFPESVAVATTEEAEVALKLAVDFAASIFGNEAVFAARMDRDEKSLTNADLFIAPRYVKKTKRQEKVAVSLSRHLKLMTEKHGTLATDKDVLRSQGRALQDAFATFLRANGYQAFRGEPKKDPEPDWDQPERWGAGQDREFAAYDREAASIARAENDRTFAEQQARLTAERAAFEDDKAKAAEKLRRDQEKASEEADHIIRVAEIAAAMTRAEARHGAQEARDLADRSAEQRKAAVARIRRMRGVITEQKRELEDTRKDVEKRERINGIVTDALDEQADALDVREKEVKQRGAEADRRITEAAVIKADVATRQTIIQRQVASVDLTEQQLALIDRAARDHRLELALDPGPRGVRMNESAMDAPERRAYHAPWSKLARSVARTVATVLSKVRELLSLARAEGDKVNLDALANADERTRLQAQLASLEIKTAEFERKREELNEQETRAAAFLAAWEAVPEHERSPGTATAIGAAKGLLQQAGASRSGNGETITVGKGPSERRQLPTTGSHLGRS